MMRSLKVEFGQIIEKEFGGSMKFWDLGGNLHFDRFKGFNFDFNKIFSRFIYIS